MRTESTSELTIQNFGSTENPIADEKLKLLTPDEFVRFRKEVAEQIAIVDALDDTEFFYWEGIYSLDHDYALRAYLTKDGIGAHLWSMFYVTAKSRGSGWGPHFLLVHEGTGEHLPEEEMHRMLKTPPKE